MPMWPVAFTPRKWPRWSIDQELVNRAVTNRDPLIMMQTVALCKKHNIKIGAHPGLPDIQGFGRREMKLQPEELTAITVYQVGALRGFLDQENVPLHHVKPHGVLYGMMCRDYEVAIAVMKGIPKGLPLPRHIRSGRY